MKELSVEQKAKAYDEALERAKSLIDFCSDSELKTLEFVFPELKESKDEQHRKWILEYLYDGLRNSDEQFKGQFKAALAWLEKQGELSICNIPSREIILAIWDLGNEWKELTKGSISTEYGTQLGYIQKHWQESEYYLRAKQGEQKPYGQREECLDCQVNYAGECKGFCELKRNEQKPAWSEEDERMFRSLHNLIYVVRDCDCDSSEKKELSDWLKSLKDRIGE